MNAAERLANSYRTDCDRLRQDLDIAEAQLRDYQGRPGAPFPHESYLSELTALRDQLKAGLSGTASEAADEAQPKVSELADRIKALKAAHTIEASPQRAGKQRSSGEEPVTARICKRTQPAAATLPPESTATAIPSSEPPPTVAGAPRKWSNMPEVRYQESAARGL